MLGHPTTSPLPLPAQGGSCRRPDPLPHRDALQNVSPGAVEARLHWMASAGSDAATARAPARTSVPTEVWSFFGAWFRRSKDRS